MKTTPHLIGLIWPAVALLALVGVSSAAAQTGVSDDRVSLPDGPGSLEGVGENLSVSGNMGLVSRQVAIEIPGGYAQATPSLALSYSSGGGNGLVGLGWSVPLPAIERMTRRGLPEYDTDDEFVGDDGSELVRIPDTDPPIYRARFESSFVRYTWHDSADGADGYWTAEYPDGRVGYFGADQSGTLVAAARTAGPLGTFRYHLVDLVDPYGHRIRYSWAVSGTAVVPSAISWGPESDGEAIYGVTFHYEARPERVSDCRPGFDEALEERISRIDVSARGTTIRQYELAYEAAADSGGTSRLASVTKRGRDGGAHPMRYDFTYTRALGADCQTSDCAKPFVVTMGGDALGLDASARNTTLVDINGDTLPDVLDTSEPDAPHRFFLNTMASDGTQSFTGPISSAYGTQDGHDLSAAAVQILDIDGDGFADLLNAQTGTAWKNRGAGDWEADQLVLWSGASTLPSDFEGGDGELQTVRFIDFDGDKRIDIIKSLGSDDDNVTTIYRNSGVGSFELATGVMNVGAGFDSDALELNDINGDGLLEPIQVLPSMVRYRLNLGWGQWGPWTEITGFSFTSQQAIDAEVEDLNADGLADLVLVSGNQVTYWLNEGGTGFATPRTLESGDLASGEIPAGEDLTVLYADMNGNGTSDVVWFTNQGAVSYLELFPVRPHLLETVSNGLGSVTTYRYESAASAVSADGGAEALSWALAYPHTMVSEVDEVDLLSGVHRVVRYRYHDGYYDPIERDFRGFGVVETTAVGDDDSQETLLTVASYDVGVESAYHKGNRTGEMIYSDGVLLQSASYDYADCPVAGLGSGPLTWAVSYRCQIGTEQVIWEGQTEGQMAGQTVLKQTSEHDGYGQVVRSANFGSVALEGDEVFTENTFVTPEDNDNRWLLGLPARQRTFGVATPDGSPADETYQETLTYYDGDDFVGLPLGQATAGAVTRRVVRVDAAGTTVTPFRAALDAHGNVVERIDPNGSVAVDTDYRWRRTYDADGLRPLVDTFYLSAGGKSVEHRQETVWDDEWDKPSSRTTMEVLVDGVSTGAPAVTAWTYDEFGRNVVRADPGTDLAAPSVSMSYALSSPISQVTTRRRGSEGGAWENVEVRCYDGLGRQFQVRRQRGDGQWAVSGTSVFNAQGQTAQSFAAWTADSGDCSLEVPEDVPVWRVRYDGLGRMVQRFEPANDDGERPTYLTVYGPLTTTEYAPEDNEVGGPHENTPGTIRVDGLGRRIAVERLLTPDGQPQVHTITWDSNGNIASVTDPAGVTRTQTYDLMGRVVSSTEPNRGTIAVEWDAANNVVREVTADGTATIAEWDALGRETASWVEGDKAATLATTVWDVAPEGCAECTWVAGRKASMTYPQPDGQAQVMMGYDPRGAERFRSIARHGQTFEFHWETDLLGRVVSAMYPNGTEVTWNRDAAGFLAEVPGYVQSVAWDDQLRPAAVTLANGVIESRSWDARGDLETLAVDAPSATLLDQSLVRNAATRIVEVIDHRVGLTHPGSGALFAYDAFGRLTAATLDEGTAFEEQIAFSLDNGERLTGIQASGDRHVGDMAYEGAGPYAVTSAAGTSMTYDATGQMVTRGSQNLVWDGRGHLVEVNNGSSNVARFAYTPYGTRTLREDDDSTVWFLTPDFEVRDGVANVRVNALGGQVALVEDPNYADSVLTDVAPATGSAEALVPAPDGRISAGDAWLAGSTTTWAEPTPVSDQGALLQAANAALLLNNAAQTSWQHDDYRKYTAVVTGSEGEVLSQAEHHPYGGVRWQTGEPANYAVTGKETDAKTGLVYFGRRYLDPRLGRWISPDPAFDLMTGEDLELLNEAMGAYAYVQGDPIQNWDGDGRKTLSLKARDRVMWTLAALGVVTGGLTAVASIVVYYRTKAIRASHDATARKVFKDIVASRELRAEHDAIRERLEVALQSRPDGPGRFGYPATPGGPGDGEAEPAPPAPAPADAGGGEAEPSSHVLWSELSRQAAQAASAHAAGGRFQRATKATEARLESKRKKRVIKQKLRKLLRTRARLAPFRDAPGGSPKNTKPTLKRTISTKL